MNGVEKKVDTKQIEIMGANENNLNNINVNIPVNQVTVVTGVSGSGKSSLVFDTVYAESERMFLESMSINAQNISSSLKKSNVYKINNLLPAIAISQKWTNRSPRSTVGTSTDISKYLRLLFAKRVTSTKGKTYTEGDFSYNNPSSWCKKCKGLGEDYSINEELLIDWSKSIEEGGVIFWEDTNKNYYHKLIDAVAEHYGIDKNIPLNLLDDNKKEFLLWGTSDIQFKIRYKNYKNAYRTKSVTFFGVFKEIYEKLNDAHTPSAFKSIQKFLKKDVCKSCNGTKLNEKILSIKFKDKNIAELEQMPISQLKNWLLDYFNYDELVGSVEKEIIPEIITRINNLEVLKLEHLALNRSMPTLSGGEAQRVKLSNQLACSLSGVLYVLDEPTMGLHSKDIECIDNILKGLKEKGNTLLLVEHNSQIMRNGDLIIDIGPGGGVYGGNIVSIGTPNEIINDKNSLTGQYLKDGSRTRKVISKEKNYNFLELYSVSSNNILNQNFKVPLNKLVVITGVSGSGKSSFIDNVLEPSIRKKANINCKNITGLEYISKVIKVDQSPIGRTPKSNVATYTGIFDLIRDIYAKTNMAKANKFTKSHFSFNVAGGRCETCLGDGSIKVDMSFMPDTYIECADCKGKRYKQELLEVLYQDKSIAEILDMTVIEAREFFKTSKRISNILQCLIDVGLDYIKIGQSAISFSGGEAQRIKLAKYLSYNSSGSIMYILDEPTVGLHFSDVEKLRVLINKIVAKGNSVVVVEHNIEVIKDADYIIDMGEYGGPKGGKIVDQGDIELIVQNQKASVASLLI